MRMEPFRSGGCNQKSLGQAGAFHTSSEPLAYLEEVFRRLPYQAFHALGQVSSYQRKRLRLPPFGPRYWVKVTFYCGHYGQLRERPDVEHGETHHECGSQGDAWVPLDDWEEGCSTILCPRCGVTLHQQDDGLELAGPASEAAVK